MSEFIGFGLAMLPAMAFVALIVTTIRVASAPGDYPPVDLLRRSYGA